MVSLSLRRLCSQSLVHGFDITRMRTEIACLWQWEELREGAKAIGSSSPAHPTPENSVVARYVASNRWYTMCAEMSSNMAGETGAVWIYRGALDACRISGKRMSPKVTDFANRHIQAEQRHLDVIKAVLSLESESARKEESRQRRKYTSLLPIWRAAGWTLGFLPTFFGKGPWLYHTVEAVESFVEEHYGAQIEYLKGNWVDVKNQFPVLSADTPPAATMTVEMGGNDASIKRDPSSKENSELLRFIVWACEDEVHHKEDAQHCLLEEVRDRNENSIVIRLWKRIVGIGSATAAEVAKRF